MSVSKIGQANKHNKLQYEMTVEPTPSEASQPSLAVKNWVAIVVIIIGCVLNPLNGSLAVTAYPQLSAYFDVPYAHMSAMVMYFMAVTAVGQPLAGGLGDFIGRKNIFLLGIAGFTVASAMASRTESFDALLGWRVTQAAFSGVIMANGMALMAQVAPKERIGRFVGFLNAAFLTATVLGFMLGGFLLQYFEWRIIFELNVPLGIAAFVLAVFVIPSAQATKAKFTALSFLGVPVLPLALGLQALVQQESALPYLALFLLSLVAVLYFVLRSDGSRQQLAGFGNQRFVLGCLILLFSVALHFAAMFTLPAWALVALGIESGMMGVYFAMIAGTQVVASPIFGHWLDQQGERYLRWYGVVGLLVPVLILIFLLLPLTFAIALILLGSGMAATQLIAQRASLMSSSEESRALAMGVFNSCRSLGGLTGNAVAALVLVGYTTIVPESGAEVFTWSLLFVVPASLALLMLKEK